MARKRMIDPSIWVDDGMAELTPRQQLLYIGLFSNADDEGRLKGSAASIRLILPTIYGGEPLEVIERDTEAVLQNMSCLIAYEADDGKRYLLFENYAKWQKIDRPQESRMPSPSSHSSPIRQPDAEQSTNNRRTIDDESLLIERNRREDRGIEKKRDEASPRGAGAHTREARRGEADTQQDEGPSTIHFEPDEVARVQALTPAFATIPGFSPSDQFWRSALDHYGGLDLDEEACKIAAWANERGKRATVATVLSWLKREAASPRAAPPRQKSDAPETRKTCSDRLSIIAGKYASYVVH